MYSFLVWWGHNNNQDNDGPYRPIGESIILLKEWLLHPSLEGYWAGVPEHAQRHPLHIGALAGQNVCFV
jgi:hypothetical protein